MTRAQLRVPVLHSGAQLEALALSEDPLKLRSGSLASYVYLELRQQFCLVKDDKATAARQWHVSTVAYYYKLADSSGRELVAWHWHPGKGSDHPHIHVAGGTMEKRVHLPTGRVSIEAVLRFLLTDLGVKPTRDHTADYAEVLAASERPFIRHRRWHARGPGDEGT